MGFVMISTTVWFGKKVLYYVTSSRETYSDIDLLIDRKISSTTEKIVKRITEEFHDVLDDLDFEESKQAKNEVDERIRNEVQRQLKNEMN